ITGADVAAALALPVLLVARTALGTINHVALTVNELRRRGLSLAGLVLVATQPGHEPHQPSNAPLIQELTGLRPAGTFPYIDGADASDPDILAAALGAAFGPDPLRALGL